MDNTCVCVCVSRAHRCVYARMSQVGMHTCFSEYIWGAPCAAVCVLSARVCVLALGNS